MTVPFLSGPYRKKCTGLQEYQKRGVTVFERLNTSVYSKRIVEAIGIEGAIRVSPLHCHTVEDIDRYLEITQELAKEFAC